LLLLNVEGRLRYCVKCILGIVPGASILLLSQIFLTP
jgi:hypothetical protein